MSGTLEYVEKRLQERRDQVLNHGIGGKSAGWKRDKDVDHLAFDLISPYGMEALAKVYKEGADKFGATNWIENPQPVGVVLNHALAHMNKFMMGDRSEDHLAKVAWGMFALIHYRDSKTTHAHKTGQCDTNPPQPGPS